MTDPFLLVDRGCFERGCMGCDYKDKGETVRVVEYQTPPPECITDGEKVAYSFGWWKGLEANRDDLRNATLEEVAKEFDKMKVLGDTAASFAAYVRNMKK